MKYGQKVKIITGRLKGWTGYIVNIIPDWVFVKLENGEEFALRIEEFEILTEDSSLKETVNIKKLIERFEDMAKRETLLARGGVKQEDLLTQIIGTIIKTAMETEESVC